MNQIRPNSGEIVRPQEQLPAGSLWTPVQGQEVRDLITHLKFDRESSERIVSEAVDVLSKSIPPTAAQTFLVNLQSGWRTIYNSRRTESGDYSKTQNQKNVRASLMCLLIGEIRDSQISGDRRS